MVCGSNDVRTDEVVDRGVVFLGWCPRCDHRWTTRVQSLLAAAELTLPEARTEAA